MNAWIDVSDALAHASVSLLRKTNRLACLVKKQVETWFSQSRSVHVMYVVTECVHCKALPLN